MEQEQLNLDRSTEPSTVVLNLEARETAWEVAPGHTIKGYGSNGKVPGPTIEARLGATLVVRLKNGLPEPTTIHWHGGLRVPAAMDGRRRPARCTDYGD
jgi:FtsP/CotA-like multicopper oxidase with cupredoxin domain